MTTLTTVGDLRQALHTASAAYVSTCFGSNIISIQLASTHDGLRLLAPFADKDRAQDIGAGGNLLGDYFPDSGMLFIYGLPDSLAIPPLHETPS